MPSKDSADGDTQGPTRRKVLGSIGAAGAAAAGTTALAGQASAEEMDPITERAREFAQEDAAVEAISSGAGQELLEELSRNGHVSEASFRGLDVDSVDADTATDRDRLSVAESHHSESGSSLVYWTKVPSEEFDRDVVVEFRPERDEALAYTRKDGETYVANTNHDGFVREATLSCEESGCSSFEYACPDSGDCDCGIPEDGYIGSYEAHKTYRNCSPDCLSCRLGCNTCGGGGGWG